MPPSRLAEWQKFCLDGLLASGVLRDDQLDGMAVGQLAYIASAYVRASASAQPFDADQAVEQAMRQRYRVRTAA